MKSQKQGDVAFLESAMHCGYVGGDKKTPVGHSEERHWWVTKKTERRERAQEKKGKQ